MQLVMAIECSPQCNLVASKMFAIECPIIIASAVVFLVVVLLLVAILLYARKRLIPSGNVKISINGGERELEVGTGNSLLSTLSAAGVFLPSACAAPAAAKWWRAEGPFSPPKRDFSPEKSSRTIGGLPAR